VVCFHQTCQQFYDFPNQDGKFTRVVFEDFIVVPLLVVQIVDKVFAGIVDVKLHEFYLVALAWALKCLDHEVYKLVSHFQAKWVHEFLESLEQV
jgi:hypothetical protein